MIALTRERDVAGAATLAALALLVLRVPGWGAVGLVAAAGVLALAVPAGSVKRSAPVWLGVVGVGVAGFGLVAMSGSGVMTATTAGLGASVVAAVAEEAVFRRALYTWLEPYGPALAIAVGAALFALVHVPAYGWGVVGIDAAAGALFGWQRWASGTWTAPAATHVLANVLMGVM